MSRFEDYYYPSRTLCSVLDEMRKCYETRNFSGVMGYLEEMQTLGNRMESALEEVKDVKDLHEKRRSLRKECTKLQEQIDKLKENTDVNKPS